MELFEPRTLRGGGGHYDPELMIDMMRGHAEGLQEGGGGGGSSVNYCSQRNLISQFEGTPASLRNCIYSVTSSTQHHQQQQQQQQYQQQQQKQQKQQKQQEVGELEEDNEDDDGVGVGEVSFHSIGGKRSSLCNWGGIMQDKVAGSEQRLSGSYSGSTRKQRSSSAPPRCRVEGCRVDLLRAKEYHRRHKVCDDHAKSPLVVVNGMDQRFCQQCSRFHLVTEFDDAKRSCRRRLASHNERRRKSTQESMALMASLGSERRSFDLIMDRSCFLPEGNTGDQVNNNWNRFPGDVMMHYPPSMKLDPLLSIAHFPNWSSGSGGGSSTSLDASNGGHHYWGGFSTNEAGLVPDASDVEEPLRLLQSTRGSSLISAPFPLLGQAELPSNCSSSTSRRALSLLSPHSPFSTPNIAPLAATSTSSSTSTSTTTTTTASTAAASFARDFNLNQSYPMINYLTSSAPPSNQLERQLAMSDVVADAGQQRDYNRLLPITMSGFASIPHDF